jgi:predicted signal transduction protein with EAL and GGDEF domain
MLFAHGALFLLRTPLAKVLPWSPTNQVFDSVWLTVLSFEALLFTIAIAFILLAMAKERTELRHKTAALVDPLTGIANRRSFLEEVISLSKRQEAEGRSVVVVLADLDHFKSINDRFGHAVGDHVLQIFAEVASAKLGPTI